jgi:hypothetical protein
MWGQGLGAWFAYRPFGSSCKGWLRYLAKCQTSTWAMQFEEMGESRIVTNIALVGHRKVYYFYFAPNLKTR